jgi:hypothetical protein
VPPVTGLPGTTFTAATTPEKGAVSVASSRLSGAWAAATSAALTEDGAFKAWNCLRVELERGTVNLSERQADEPRRG